MNDPRLIEGISDAVGFLGGALLGYWAGKLLGLDMFAPGYSFSVIFAMLLVGVGGGTGLKLARSWRAARNESSNDVKKD